MAVHASLKNEFTEDQTCHNLVSWLKLTVHYQLNLSSAPPYLQALGCGLSLKMSWNEINPHLPSGPVHPYELDKSI